MTENRPKFAHYKRFLTKLGDVQKLKKERVTVILSPHIDDAFLSLGSYIESGKLGKNIVAINVFSLTDSKIATNVRADFKALVQTSVTRMQEELKLSDYFSRKGINYIPVFVGLKDAAVETYYSYIVGKGIKSLPQFIKGRALGMHKAYVNKRMEDLRLKTLIDSLLSQFKNIYAVMAPVGIGDHIDHMMLRKYAESLNEKFKIGLYADIPYTYQYGLVSPKKLQPLLPKGFVKQQIEPFDPMKKDRLFRSIYKSQYDSGVLEAFKSIAKNGGEIIFWNK